MNRQTLFLDVFAQVHRARCKTSGEFVALKHVYYDAQGSARPIHVTRELDALSRLQGHPNIVEFLGPKEGPSGISLVLKECCADLGAVLRKMKLLQMPQAVIKAITIQALTAIAACHRAGFAHRDVSPSNLLFDASGVIRLADFGQARPLNSNSPLSPVVGTRWYRAPELLFGARQYTTAVDLWSLGCVFGELLSGKALFPGNSDIDQICRIREVLGSPDEIVWPGVVDLPDWGKLIFPPKGPKPWENIIFDADASSLDLLRALLRYDPDSRLTATEALKHAYFTEDPAPAGNNQVLEFVTNVSAHNTQRLYTDVVTTTNFGFS